MSNYRSRNSREAFNRITEMVDSYEGIIVGLKRMKDETGYGLSDQDHKMLHSLYHALCDLAGEIDTELVVQVQREEDEEEARRWAEHEADVESQENDLDRFWSETREVWA